MTQASAPIPAKKRAIAKTARPAAAPKVVKAATKTRAKSPIQSPTKTVAKSAAPVAKKATPQAPTVVLKTATAPAKPAKEKKVKVVRDSFTLPKIELLEIAEMKKRAMALGVEMKKSELIRAGLRALSALTDAPFKKALGNVPTIKTGRPAKS